MPLPGQLAGKVLLQGRSNHSGATISIAGQQGLTTADGSYFIAGVAPGSYTVIVDMGGYLGAQRSGVGREAGLLTMLPDVTLVAGDANSHGIVDIFDLVIEAIAIASQPGSPNWDDRADTNGDRRVDILDLVLTGGNFGARGPSPWY
ncbi:MAG: carboxypeptidase regulatory-like domain-containing protein [Chloroflexi bacterium]|nr:carboxypeptidase regulatory-like domain-containing protein [Chloroflexota bacterium]